MFPVVYKKTAKNALAVIFYLFLTILYTYPSVLHITTKIVGDGGDGLEYFSYLYTVKENLLKGKFPYGHTDIYRYPNGVNTMVSEAKAFTLTGGVISLFFDNIIVYNLLIYMAFVLDAYVSYLFYRKLAENFGLGLLGGLIYGFSVWNIVSGYGAVTVLLSFGIPLLGLVVLDVVDNGLKSKHVYYIALCFGLLAACYVVALIVGLLGLLAVLLTIFILDTKLFVVFLIKSRIKTKHLITAFLLLVSFCLFIYKDHYIALLNTGKKINELTYISPIFSVAALITPPSVFYKSQISEWLIKAGFKPTVVGWQSEPLYVGGTVIVVLIIIGLTIKKQTSLRLFFLNTLFFGTISFFGIFFLPLIRPLLVAVLFYPLYYLKYHHHYFMMLFWFFTTGTIILWLKQVKAKNILIYLLFIPLCLERLNTGYPTTDAAFYKGGSYAKKLQAIPGKAVLDLPLINLPFYNLLPFEYKKPIVSGQTHWLGLNDKENALTDRPELKRFFCNSAQESGGNTFSVNRQNKLNKNLVELLKKYDIRTVVLHRDQLIRERCLFVRKQLAFLFKDLTMGEINIVQEDYDRLHSLISPVLSADFVKILSNEDAVVFQML